jgi:hypothetical protein
MDLCRVGRRIGAVVSAPTFDELLARCRSTPGIVEVRDAMTRPVAAGIGPYTSTPVGRPVRSISVIYDCATRLESDPDADAAQRLRAQPLTPPADDLVRAACDDLWAACRREGVSVWQGSTHAGIGCWRTYTAPDLARAMRLAEDIRVTRIRALEWPGRGHEERLSDLMREMESS